MAHSLRGYSPPWWEDLVTLGPQLGSRKRDAGTQLSFSFSLSDSFRVDLPSSAEHTVTPRGASLSQLDSDN